MARFAVSVVIPVHDAATTVAAAVRSALGQPEVDEVVMVDDASTDAGPEICRRMRDADPGRITLVATAGEEARGPGHARNLGIAVARGEWIAFLDADDVYRPGRFRAARQVAATRPDAAMIVDVVGIDHRNVDRQGLPDVVAFRPPPGVEPVLALIDGRFGGVSTPGVTVRRRVLVALGGFPERLMVGEDAALWIIVAASVPVALGSSRPVATYLRRRGSQTTSDRQRSAEAPVAVIRFLLGPAAVWRMAERHRRALHRQLAVRAAGYPVRPGRCRHFRKAGVLLAWALRYPPLLLPWWVPRLVRRLVRGRRWGLIRPSGASRTVGGTGR